MECTADVSDTASPVVATISYIGLAASNTMVLYARNVSL